MLLHRAEVKLQASFYTVASLQSSTHVLLLHYKAVHMCCCFTTKQYICAVASLQSSTYVLLLHKKWCIDDTISSLSSQVVCPLFLT